MVDSCSMIVVKNGCILLLQRGMTDPWMPGRWCLPGGKMDPGETPRQAAIRELLEEAGISPSRISHFDTYSGEGRNHHIFCALSHTGEVTLPDGECSDYCWVTRDEARLFPLIPQLSRNIHKMFDFVESLGTTDAI